MKKLEKAWIFIWAGAMLLFGLLTVNGLRFQYGDTVRTIVRGVDDSIWAVTSPAVWNWPCSLNPACLRNSSSWTMPGKS